MSCCPRGSQLISFYSPIQMSEGNCDILLFGTMGHIGEDVQHCLERHRLKVARVEFPQNVFRDESGYRRSLAKSLEHYSPAVVMPVGDSYAMSRAKDLLPAGCCATVDSPEKTALLNGKVSFSALCGKLGIRQPRLYSTVSETGLPSAAQAGKMDKDEIAQHWCQKVHGLGPADTDGKPNFKKAWNKIRNKINHDPVPFVAHNASFDSKCLAMAMRVYQMEDPGYKFYDTLASSRRWFGNRLPNHQLHTVAAACGFDLRNHHNALADAEACAAIALKTIPLSDLL